MISPRLAACLAVAACLMRMVIAADVPESNQPKSGKIADLPATVSPAKGSLSLIADYTHEQNGVVWVYLVNATDAPVSLPSQDGDLYSKRESPDAQNQWMRCDRHGYSWCGNSYVPITIPSGDYYSWRQSLNSAKGEIRPVRFRLYNEQEPAIVSNEGKARIDPAEIEQCRYDAMAFHYGPLEDIAAVAVGKAAFSGGQMDDPLILAVDALYRFQNDPRFFDTMVQIIESLQKSDAIASKERRPMLEYVYERALNLLSVAAQSTDAASRERNRDFLIAQFNDPKNPWHLYAFLELSSAYKADRQVQSLITQIVDSPKESVFPWAIREYAEFTPKAKLLARLTSMETDLKYSRANRAAVKQFKEEIQKSDSKKSR